MAEAALTKVGRPRDPHVDEAILSAALDLLIEEGFPRLSIEGVAARAGVGKAAIYRRWDSKTSLVVDAINERVVCGIDFPDTGDFRADVEAVLTQVLIRIRGVEGKVWKAVVSELVKNEELAELFRREFVAVRRADMISRVKAAMDSGQLPPGDVELLADVGSAMVHHRMLVSGEPPTDDLPKRIVRQFFPREENS
jgi:AcrR family transcriptional regulator